MSSPAQDQPHTPSEDHVDPQGNAEENGGETGARTSAPTGEGEAGERTFGGLSPREAGLRSAERRREREAAASAQLEAQADDVRMVYVPVSIGKIIQRYDQDARNGSVSAGKELRSWLETYPPVDEALDVGALDRDLRRRMLTRLMAECQQEVPAQS